MRLATIRASVAALLVGAGVLLPGCAWLAPNSATPDGGDSSVSPQDASAPVTTASIDAPPGALPAGAAALPAEPGEAPPLPRGLIAPAGIWAFTPHETRLNAAVTVVVPAPASVPVAQWSLFTAEPSTGTWSRVEGAVSGGGAMRAVVDHFSYFGVLVPAGPGCAGITAPRSIGCHANLTTHTTVIFPMCCGDFAGGGGGVYECRPASSGVEDLDGREWDCQATGPLFCGALACPALYRSSFFPNLHHGCCRYDNGAPACGIVRHSTTDISSWCDVPTASETPIEPSPIVDCGLRCAGTMSWCRPDGSCSCTGATCPVGASCTAAGTCEGTCYAVGATCIASDPCCNGACVRSQCRLNAGAGCTRDGDCIDGRCRPTTHTCGPLCFADGARVEWPAGSALCGECCSHTCRASSDPAAPEYFCGAN